ncbi:uncharacterized protein LOC135693502 [Rhopilema esculentum]|uniref:uncharacterized protein LOC135693502 n=1 Tax=Rhopilema esculentum TaxID=499914 RepID=UPI0031D68F19
MSDGTIFCKRMELLRKGGINKLRKEPDQGRLLNSNTIDVLLQYCERVTKGRLLLDIRERNLVCLQMDVFLPEVTSLLVHLVEGIPMISARRICISPSIGSVVDNTTLIAPVEFWCIAL